MSFGFSETLRGFYRIMLIEERDHLEFHFIQAAKKDKLSEFI